MCSRPRLQVEVGSTSGSRVQYTMWAWAMGEATNCRLNVTLVLGYAPPCIVGVLGHVPPLHHRCVRSCIVGVLGHATPLHRRWNGVYDVRVTGYSLVST